MANKDETFNFKEPSPIFAVTSGFDVPEPMKSCLKKFKLEFQKSINKDTTHVVMHTVPSASQVCDRSLKFLIGISKGLWVVNDGWLTDSVKANRIMLEDDYEIKGDSIISAEHEGPRKARTRSSPLFQDYSFILLNFDGDGKLSPGDITQIVENLGGKTSEKVDDSEGKCIALVYDDGDGSSTKDERILPFQGSTDISGTQCVTVSVFWLLDCVTTFSILEVEDYLYTFEQPNVEHGRDADSTEDEDDDYIPESDYSSSEDDMTNTRKLHTCIENLERKVTANGERTGPVKENDNTDLLEKTPDLETASSEDTSSISTVYPSTTTPQVIIQERFSKCQVKQQKYFSCLYCETLVTKLPRHLERRHPFEDKVKEALQLPKGSNERRLAWLAIQQEGNYNHNYNVLSKGSGLLIPKYRAREHQHKSVEDYVPCDICFGLYVKKDLWKHHMKCRISRMDTGTSTSTSKKQKPVANGKLLLPKKAETDVNDNILLKMRNDEVKSVILKDTTLLNFACRMYEQNGHLQHRHQYLAQRLRELGRMLLAIQEKSPSVDTIEKCLDPSNWEEVIVAVRSVAGFDSKTNQYTIPTLPLRVGQSLVKCAKLLKTKSIVISNEELRKKMEGFVELYESEWGVRIAAKCHNTLHVAKFNKPQLLPVTKDVQKLHNYLKQESEKLRKDCQIDDYRRFAEICLAQIILFNRKRSGEAERIHIKDFQGLLIDTQVDEDIYSSLTQLEKEIIKSHKRIEIVGKRGSKVPVILTDDMIQNLNCLLKIREGMSISSDFLFGKCNSQFPIRGSDALRNLAVESGASNPSLLTSTKLRKQLATVSQLLGLNEHGQDALAKFMGHDIRVHRSYYELPENTMQLARMSRVLHAVNEGKAKKVQNLDNIIVTEEDVMMDEDDSDSDEDPDQFVKDDDKQAAGRCQQRKNVNRNQGPQSWCVAEQQAVLRHLGKLILSGKLPGKLVCEDVIKKEAILHRRPWQQIKHFIRNKITSKTRKNNPVLLPFS